MWLWDVGTDHVNMYGVLPKLSVHATFQQYAMDDISGGSVATDGRGSLANDFVYFSTCALVVCRVVTKQSSITNKLLIHQIFNFN